MVLKRLAQGHFFLSLRKRTWRSGVLPNTKTRNTAEAQQLPALDGVWQGVTSKSAPEK